MLRHFKEGLHTQKEIQVEPPFQNLSANLVGKPLKRKEDLRFIRGASKFVDDFKLPSMLFAHVVRSSYASAKFKIETSAALQVPGIKLIYTGKDVIKHTNSITVPPNDEQTKSAPHPILALDRVRFSGEPIAFIVGESKQLVEDIEEMIEVEYSPLPVVVDPEVAMLDSSPRIHDDIANNIAYHQTKNAGDIDGSFASADQVIHVELLNQRLAPSPMEPRGILADYNSDLGTLTLILGNQQPYEIKERLAEILNLDENKIRIISPDIGGSFGSKFWLYPEDILTCLTSIELGRPIKWIESRSENFASMVHGRGQKQIMDAAVNNDGKILGLKVKIISDSGAYPFGGTFFDPRITVDLIPSLYKFEAFSSEMFCIYTNKMTFDAYRGAGMPEAIYLIERTVDRIARKLNLDPARVRSLNFITKEEFPFTSLTGFKYDVGDYETNLKAALELSSYDKWRRIQKEEISKGNKGRMIGVGLCTFVLFNSWGPNRPQTASVTIGPSGNVRVVAASSPQGQGHETPYAQIAADQIGLSIEDIVVVYGDTDRLAWGSQTGGDRSASLGGSAVLSCALKIKEKMALIAAKKLGIDPNDLVFENGKIFSRRDPCNLSTTFSTIAAAAYKPLELPIGMEPGLYEFSSFTSKNWTYPFGTHVAVVEVDRQTGKITILDYIAVDDVGRVINPMIVEGQIQGGVMQGAGQALLENVVYDNEGQLLTRSFMDYQIPEACDMLPIKCYRTNTPTAENPLGVKGVGENGTVASTPALVNAVEDAISSSLANVYSMPLTLEYVYQLIHNDKT